MTDLTLEALAKRVEALEKKLAEQEVPKKDWRSVVGISEYNEFTRAMEAEIEANREAERRAALEATFDDEPEYDPVGGDKPVVLFDPTSHSQSNGER